VISFLQPWALLALAAAAIPALLHLLGRRLPPVVVFPAVRYLTATEREHSRRLKLRNLLLLVLRTLAIVFLVVAAARPVARLAVGTSHPPTAVALIVDNSLSSSAVVEGQLLLSALLEAGRTVLRQIATGDRLWLVLADGVPQRMTRLEALRVFDSITPVPVRLDVSDAIRVSARVLQDDPLPAKQVVLLSDLQASALSGGPEVGVPVLAVGAAQAPQNRSVDSALSEPPVWSPGGTVVAGIGGEGGSSTTVRLTAGGRDVARTVAEAGEQVALAGEVDVRGWTVASIELDPDELRADDRRYVPLFSAPATATSATPGSGRFVAAALAVLQQGGRVVAGTDVQLSDGPVSGTTIVFPPAEAALVGAVNRSLAASGVSLRFGELLRGEWRLESEVGGGSTVLQRHRLAGQGAVSGWVGDEEWLAREGNMVLVASRMEPEWGDLPVSAQFVPFLDFLINRVAARQAWMSSVTAGDPVTLPAGSVELVGEGASLPVPGDLQLLAPLEFGVYFARSADGDTIGALAVNHDNRESRLRPATERELRALLGPTVTLVDTSQLEWQLFAGFAHADLTGLLLVAALLAVLTEFAVATAGRAFGGIP
jgi:hypothetical protein